MNPTRETLAAAIDHAQNVVNAAALHTATVARLNVLIAAAPELQREYASDIGKLNDFHVADAISTRRSAWSSRRSSLLPPSRPSTTIRAIGNMGSRSAGGERPQEKAPYD